MVNNADWLERFGYIDFLRDFGVAVHRQSHADAGVREEPARGRAAADHPRVQLHDDAVGGRLLELHRRYGCTLQFGGSEQWGNIVNGIDLIRRLDAAEAYGVTAPLVTTAAGVKMGKTVDGAVWLNAELRSPYDYWQFWRNTDDADVGRFLRLFTDLPLAEIARLEALAGAEINDAKKVLANEATTMLHGADAADAAADASRAAFEEGRVSEDLPSIDVPRSQLEAGVPLAAVATEAGLAASRGEARRLAQGGGLRINDAVETDGQRMLTLADASADGVIKLAAGRKKIVLVRAV